MRDIAFVALLVFLVLLAVGINIVVRMAGRVRASARDRAKWREAEWSDGGVTRVAVQKVVRWPDGREEIVETREVGQVADDASDYEERLLSLRATALERLAVVR